MTITIVKIVEEGKRSMIATHPGIASSDRGLLRDVVWIGGEWDPADDGSTIAVPDEADGAAFARVSASGLAETEDTVRAAAAAQSECGMVGVNTGLLFTEVAPISGSDRSGLGREGSRYGIEDHAGTK